MIGTEIFHQNYEKVQVEKDSADEERAASTSDNSKLEEVSIKDELLSVLEQCGHRLHHRKGGKHGQKRILRILNSDSPMTQKDLQEKLNIQAGSMSEILTKLENNGFVIKKRDESDKRKAVLLITDKGREAFAADRENELKNNRHLFDSLTEDEQISLLNILQKLNESWREASKRHDENSPW